MFSAFQKKIAENNKKRRVVRLYIDGVKHCVTPEISIQIQKKTGRRFDIGF